MLPLFPPPQCGSSDLTHALIICPEKLAGDKHPIMALYPVPSALFQMTAFITKRFENQMTLACPHYKILLLICFFLSCVPFVLNPFFFSASLFVFNGVDSTVRWSTLTEISWSQDSLGLQQISCFWTSVCHLMLLLQSQHICFPCLKESGLEIFFFFFFFT